MKTLKFVIPALALAFFVTACTPNDPDPQENEKNNPEIRIDPQPDLVADANVTPDLPATTAEWSVLVHDFGKITQGTPVETTFEFKNTGENPLVLSNVKAACGCTATEYTKEPVQPGESGFVKGVFNAQAEGVFNKTITVTTNTAEKATVLTIKGEVGKKKD